MGSVFKKIVVSIIIFLVLLEVALRVFWGFCNAPLYVADDYYEYIYAPNQDITRFGNRVVTNSLSMRSKELSPSDSLIILLIGDSVINGGSMTDQDSIASTLLERKLSEKYQKSVRILNISAGSWGPDNGAAYLKKHGTFNASLMCLVTSSHDAYDNMTHHDQVGVDPGLPMKQYSTALYELWEKYIYRLFLKDLINPNGSFAPKLQSDFGAAIRKDGVEFNPGYGQLQEIAQSNSIPFFILLHPEISEVIANEYDDQGKAIIKFAEANSIRLVRELDLKPTLDLYRPHDVVHYTPRGQVFLAENLYTLFVEYLNNDN